MTTSQDLLERIEGQNLAKRFLINADRNRDVEVLRWKDSDGAWQSWTMAQLSDVTARLVTGLAELGVDRMLDDWHWLSLMFNRVNRAMGQRDLYPFELTEPVKTKLAFVHSLIAR